MKTESSLPPNPIESFNEPGQDNLYAELAVREPSAIQEEKVKAIKVLGLRSKKAGEPAVFADATAFNNNISGLNPPVRLKDEVAAAEGVPTSPYSIDGETAERLRGEFDEPQEWTDPETNQKFTIRILNRGASDSNPLFFMQPFSASPGEFPQHRNSTMLRAAYLKQHTMVVVESAGLGGSDKPTKDQKKGLKKDGSSMKIGKSLVNAAVASYPAKMGSKINSIKAAGHSMGGWSAVGLARAASERGISVSGLVSVDAPGFRDTHNLAPIAAGTQMLIGFAGEGEALQQMPVGLDPATRAAVQEGVQKNEVLKLGSRMWRQRTMAYRLGKAKLVDDLSAVLQLNPSLTVSIIEASTSKVTKPYNTQTKQLLANLEEGLDQAGIPHGQIDYTLLHGETHAVDANPGRAAYLIEQGLRARPKVKIAG